LAGVNLNIVGTIRCKYLGLVGLTWLPWNLEFVEIKIFC